MSWLNCTVTIEGKDYPAKMRGNEVFIPAQVGEVLSISIDGSYHEVESLRIDSRDGVVYLTVKQATAKPNKRSKSDDEPVKGGDDPNTSE